jgi:hypothetical protein
MTGLRLASVPVIVLVACGSPILPEHSGDDVVLSAGTGSSGHVEEDSTGAPPPGCAHACEEGAAVCEDGAVVACAAGEDGCWRWGEPEACPEGQVCSDGACAAAPGFSRLGDAWPLPDGGRTGEGFSAGSGEPATVGDDSWSLLDLDGDGALDLVITAVAHQDGDAWVTRAKGYPLTTFWEVHFGGQDGGYRGEPHAWSVPPGVGLAGRGLVTPAGLPGGSTDHAWTLRDVDGDGRLDLLVTGYGAPKGDSGQIDPLGTVDARRWDVYFSTGAGFADTATPWSLALDLTFGTAAGELAAAGGFAWDTFDIDGDGWCDLVMTGFGEPLSTFGTPEEPSWLVYRGSAEGLQPDGEPLHWRVPPGGGVGTGFSRMSATDGAPGDELWAVLDVDGDGRRELVVTGRVGDTGPAVLLSDEGTPQWRIHRAQDDGFEMSYRTYAVPGGRGGSNDRGLYAIRGGQDVAGKLGGGYDHHGCDLLDVDGDRRLDLVVTNEALPYQGVYTRAAIGGDADPYWELYLGTGEGFAGVTRWPTPTGGVAGRGFLWARGVASPVPQVEGASTWETGDLDGDGRPELVVTALAVPVEGETAWHWEAPGFAAMQPHWQVFRQAPK